jgi:hypothetical protein
MWYDPTHPDGQPLNSALRLLTGLLAGPMFTDIQSEPFPDLTTALPEAWDSGHFYDPTHPDGQRLNSVPPPATAAGSMFHYLTFATEELQ